MRKKKIHTKESSAGEVVFISPEGINSLEVAIANLEYIYNEMAKRTKRHSATEIVSIERTEE